MRFWIAYYSYATRPYRRNIGYKIFPACGSTADVESVAEREVLENVMLREKCQLLDRKRFGNISQTTKHFGTMETLIGSLKLGGSLIY